MNEQITPLEIDGIDESLYAGFWSRLGSILLDLVFIIPFTGLILYINNLKLEYYYFTILPSILFGLFYHVFLVQKYGGTPGKLLLSIKIIKLNGENIGWMEAILRYSVLFLISLFAIFMMTNALAKADANHYENLSWIQKSQYLTSLSPALFSTHNWINSIWVYGELIVLLTNKRKRAIHDYIARTVIIKDKYYDDIIESMILLKK